MVMKWKEFITDYLTFTRKDRIGVLVVIVLLLIVVFLPALVSHSHSSKTVKADADWIAAMKKLEVAVPKKIAGQFEQQNNDDESYAYQFDRSKNNNYDRPKRELFYFNPNTIKTEEWKKLGLRDKTIYTIQNYLSKGGHFKKPEDLQKIYGLFPHEYEKIAPYIKIDPVEETKKFKDVSDKTPFENQPIKNYTSRYSIIDINLADTNSLIALPGIGSKLAARIVNFRDKLGGFYLITQVGETFGLPDSTFQKIKQYLELDTTSIKKININTATIDELKAHPYIKWSIANPIIVYRNEHGFFSNVEGIKKIIAISEELYVKIAPYLTTQ